MPFVQIYFSVGTTSLERDPPKRWRTGIDRLVYELGVYPVGGGKLTPAKRTAGKPEEIVIVEGANRKEKGKAS